jgi:hypothetical protein
MVTTDFSGASIVAHSKAESGMAMELCYLLLEISTLASGAPTCQV